MNTKVSLERWKKVKGLEKYYWISDHGRIRSRFKILKQRITRNYLYARLQVSDNGYKLNKNLSVHRVVAINFVDNPLNKPQVNHIDGNKLNNHYANLEWVTAKENVAHALKTGLTKLLNKGSLRFKRSKIDKVFELRKQGMYHKDIANRLGMGVSTVTHVLNWTRRKHQ